jgi:hypothetical protein
VAAGGLFSGGTRACQKIVSDCRGLLGFATLYEIALAARA